jgi:uncharacterized membrane protein
MQLSDADKKLVERLKQQQRSLIRWRWIGLAAAPFGIVLGCYGIAVVDHFLHQPDAIAAMVVAFLIPTIYLLVLGGVWLAVYLVLNWNGKPETRLLLKLIEDSHDNA